MKRSEILIGLGLSIFVGVILSPFASSWPDGLEWIAEQYGFIELAQEEPITPRVIPDYEMPGFSGGWATATAGFLGTAFMYFAGWSMAKILAKRKSASPSEQNR